MAKRTRSTKAKPAASLPKAEVVSSPPPPAPAPVAGTHRRFWHDFEIGWAKWTVFRFVFFSLHAADAFIQIGHAPRYGAGGFNVQQLPGGFLPEPSRAGMTFVYGMLCVLFALIAQGAAVRWALPIATALYGYAYFVSQLDSYQHHYLMWLVLLLLCFVPTRPDPRPPGGRIAWLRAWSLRLLLCQLAIVYAWAAFAKLDPVWLDGSALARQVHTGWIRSLCSAIGFDRVAIVVLVVEGTLAATVWWRRGWLVALPLGLGMHVGIELIGLDIGLFSYFMMALYLLLLPDGIYPHLVEPLERLFGRLSKIPSAVRFAISAAVILASLVVVLRHPLPLGKVGMLSVPMCVLLVGFGRGGMTRRMRTAALAVAPLAVFLTISQIPADHFRTWAGASRRLGLDDERAAYHDLLAVEPTSEYAHYYLGQLDLKAGHTEEALEHFHIAERLVPKRARAYLAEVAVHVVANRNDLALDTLERGLARDPGNPELNQRKAALAATVPAEKADGK